VAALCVSAPTTRLSQTRFAEVRAPLEGTAAEISRLLQTG
jgi:DNA-binding IclR family transcriptional regulator